MMTMSPHGATGAPVAETRSSPLTDKQRAVYTLVLAYYDATGEPCSLAWLARRLQKHRETIHLHIRAIQRKGWATAHAFERLL